MPGIMRLTLVLLRMLGQPLIGIMPVRLFLGNFIMLVSLMPLLGLLGVMLVLDIIEFLCLELCCRFNRLE